jgi:hypothetical protein
VVLVCQPLTVLVPRHGSGYWTGRETGVPGSFLSRVGEGIRSGSLVSLIDGGYVNSKEILGTNPGPVICISLLRNKGRGRTRIWENRCAAYSHEAQREEERSHEERSHEENRSSTHQYENR